MFFNPRSLLMGATAFLLSGVATAADCANGPWTNVRYIGGQGGGEWCHNKWDEGIVIKGIEVWASKKGVRAVQFYYSDGSNSEMVGKTDDIEKHDYIEWDPIKDGISQFKSWGNGKGEYLGRVYLRLKSGKEFDVGKDTDGQDTFEQDVQSGILLGAYGRGGDMVDGMGVLFLKSKINKITVENVKFSDTADDLNERMQGLNNVMIDYADHKNNQAEADDTFSFAKKQTRAVTKTYTTSDAYSVGMSEAVELSGEILGIGAKSTTTLSFDTTSTYTQSDSVADTTDLTYTTTTTVKPGTKVYCRATAMMGQYEGTYTGDTKVWLEDGSDFSFATTGKLEQVTWAQASSECQNDPFTDDMPTAEAPLASEEIDTKRRAVKFLA